jgi:hypothetical protein
MLKVTNGRITKGPKVQNVEKGRKLQNVEKGRTLQKAKKGRKLQKAKKGRKMWCSMGKTCRKISSLRIK